jgi:hypothetical protein
VPLIPFATSFGDRGYGLPPLRLQNMFPEASVYPDRPVVLLPTPGLTRLATVGTGPIRGIWREDGVLSGACIVVSGVAVYRLTSAGAVTLLGTIGGTGPVIMAGSASQLVIVSEPTAWVCDGSTVVQITDEDFPLVRSVAYINGYFIFASAAGNGQIVWSALLDAGAYDALDFATAESAADDVRRVEVDQQDVFLFGARTLERWINTGVADAPFERRAGGVTERGLLATHALARLDNTLFFVGDDRIVYRLTDGVQRVSTHAIESELEALSDENAAELRMWAHALDGHTFAALDVPGRGTWCFDASTGQWHERATFGELLWRVGCGTAVFGRVLTGSRIGGQVYYLDKAATTDDGTAIERAIYAGVPVQGGRPPCDNVSLDGIKGVVSISETFGGYSLVEGALLLQDGSALLLQDGLSLAFSGQVELPSVATQRGPKVMMRFSDDGGMTWSNERAASLGLLGQREKRTVWHALGRMRPPGRLFEFRVTDAARVVVNGVRVNEAFA